MGRHRLADRLGRDQGEVCVADGDLAGQPERAGALDDQVDLSPAAERW
jgi:hypothetical protein